MTSITSTGWTVSVRDEDGRPVEYRSRWRGIPLRTVRVGERWQGTVSMTRLPLVTGLRRSQAILRQFAEGW